VLSDLTDERVRAYVRQRQGEETSGRTINMEVGELSRAIGQPWSLLWPKVRKMEERKDVGKALSDTEQKALLDGLRDLHTPHLPTLIPLLLLTGMRPGEALSLTWGQIDLMDKTITVGRAKTSNGTGRIIPFSDELASLLAVHRGWFAERFGGPNPDQHLFPWGKPFLPTRCATLRTSHGDGTNCARLQACPAVSMTSGTRSLHALRKRAFLNPPCLL
jgi:integrase